MYCNKCGHQIEDTWGFCGFCGAPRRVVVTPASPAQVGPPSSVRHEMPASQPGLVPPPTGAPGFAAGAQPAAAPGASEARQPAHRPAGRAAIRVLSWGASLALLGWIVWLASVWKDAEAPSDSLGCTIGQATPYGTCTPATQRFLSTLSSASSKLASQSLPDYHLNFAFAGAVLAIAALVAAYFYFDSLLPGPGGPRAPDLSWSPAASSRRRGLSVVILISTVALAADGALLVHTLGQLSSAISTANRVCAAAGISCVSASSIVALIAGWLAVGTGILALAGGLLCAVVALPRGSGITNPGSRPTTP